MTDSWYKEMGSAIARRDRAVAARDKWDNAIRAAEENIRQLAAMRPDGAEIAAKVAEAGPTRVDEDLANEDEDE